MRKNPVYTELAGQICCIDTLYQRPGLAACYLIESAGQAAFIDTGTAPRMPMLMQILAAKGIRPAQVSYVIATHVHLDHAGAAGQLMQALPAARLVVHPLGAPHLIDPTKLIAGATAVYGAQHFTQLYGELLPVPAARVIEAQDDGVLQLGDRLLRCLDTPGHARHHICVYDELTRGVFTGDTFGLSYREFDSAQGPFMLPTTTPVQFDPEAWHSSLERLMAFQPKAVYLTHFGRLEAPQQLVQHLHQGIDDFVNIAVQAPEKDPSGYIKSALREWSREKLATHGCQQSKAQIDRLLDMDLELNTQGLMVWLARRRKTQQKLAKN